MDSKNKNNRSPIQRGFMFGIGAGIAMAIIFLAVAGIMKIACKPSDQLSDPTRPHSKWLIMRDTIEGGFSRGWMPHFLPSEEYWIDMHIHLRGISGSDDLKSFLDDRFMRLDAYRLRKIVAIVSQDNQFELLNEYSEADSRFAWMYWPRVGAPSVSKVREAVRNGACALKLHNSSIMAGRTPRDIYENEEWQAIFAFAESAGIPLLWHVTQRLGFSPYHGGGLNSYWSDGWERGIRFNNEDLLQDVLKLMKRYPRLKVIGAHQLHVGIDRLNELFKEYENLYIDSSCGMLLRYSDEFIEADRLLLRDFVETWSERILFATDGSLGQSNMNEYAVQWFLGHTKFMLKLGLNDKALQDVAWRTTERVLNFPTMPPVN